MSTEYSASLLSTEEARLLSLVVFCYLGSFSGINSLSSAGSFSFLFFFKFGIGSKPIVEGGGGEVQEGVRILRRHWGLPPTLQEVARSFLFVVQWHLVFLFEVVVNTCNDEIGRLGNEVPV